MSVSETERWSLRMERAESTRLAWALAISLLLHLLCFGIYYGGKKMDVWKNIQLPQWTPRFLTQLSPAKLKPTTKPAQSDPPLVFVEVSPAQATAEPPRETPYYSDRNSRAANKQAERDTGIPNLTGSQARVVATEDVPKEKFVPMQPSPAPTPKVEVEQQEIKAAPAVKPGDLQVGKPEEIPKPDTGQAKKARPRTIASALASKGMNQLPSQKMKQEGGTPTLNLDALDAKATPFGAYDRQFTEAVKARWYTLLEDRDYAAYANGKVVLQFHLHYDGRISGMRIAENTAGEVLGLICQKAVLDPAPYPPWPSDLRRLAGDTRSVQFTFYYN